MSFSFPLFLPKTKGNHPFYITDILCAQEKFLRSTGRANKQGFFSLFQSPPPQKKVINTNIIKIKLRFINP